MVNWGVAVPIIVAIIGVIGTSIIAPLLTFYPQLNNKPSLEIAMHSNDGKTVIDLNNFGTIPATNITLMLTPNEANRTIHFITNQFSTEDVRLLLPTLTLLNINEPVLVNQPFVKLYIEKLVNGYGSLIELDVNETHRASTNFAAYATYDQGSVKTIEGDPSTRSSFSSNLLPWWFYLIIALVAIFYIVVAAYVLILLYKRKKAKFISKITDQMLKVRRELKRNSYYDQTFPFTLPRKQGIADILADCFLFADIFNSDTQEMVWGEFAYCFFGFKVSKRRAINAVNDYIRIDDFYSELGIRDEYIRNTYEGMPDKIAVLKKQNKKCLALVETALDGIDWSKYK